MVQCQCYTGKDGQGPQCSRPVKEGSLCAQHKKLCLRKAGQHVQHVQKVQKPQPVQHVQHVQKVQKVEKVQKAKKPKKVQKVQKVQKPDAKPRRGCVQQKLKKYVERPSPPFPANECCGEVMQGNDGGMYISKANVKGICQWKPFKG